MSASAWVRSAVGLVAALCLASNAVADNGPALPFDRIAMQKTMTPVTIDGRSYKLETLIFRADDARPRPLAVISHGNPRDADDRQSLSLNFLAPVAQDMARRGYVAAVFARRGFAGSEGRYVEGNGPCDEPDYVRAGKRAAEDYRAMIVALRARADVDGGTTVAIGQSGGGFATLALGKGGAPGLKGLINFAGGRGSTQDFRNCDEPKLAAAFGAWGAASAPPSLWLYSSADRYFWPDLVDRMHRAYTGAGGRAMRPAIGALKHFEDGHKLIERGNLPIWRPLIDRFLDANGLPNWTAAPPDPVLLDDPGPPYLSDRGKERWRRFLGSGLHKAFVVYQDGRGFGWASGRESQAAAIADAMAFCEGSRRDRECKPYAVNDARVR